jgi:hypothetical protein
MKLGERLMRLEIRLKKNRMRVKIIVRDLKKQVKILMILQIE